MNREILFRGKRVDSSEWFEGSYWLSRSAVENWNRRAENGKV